MSIAVLSPVAAAVAVLATAVMGRRGHLDLRARLDRRGRLDHKAIPGLSDHKVRKAFQACRALPVRLDLRDLLVLPALKATLAPMEPLGHRGQRETPEQQEQPGHKVRRASSPPTRRCPWSGRR
jgi:hypothetical protein